jgi:large subunit ribosomal protein L3
VIEGIIGRKKGMTQIFHEDGTVVPVTVIEAQPARVVQLRTAERDGYTAVQLGAFPTKAKRIGKPRTGHLAKRGLEPLRRLKELRVDSLEGFEAGQEIKVGDVFAQGDRVDVQGVSRGLGFAGVVKRHGFSRGDMTHGGMSKRRPGSIGACATPSRVFKGKRMAGHMGSRKVTARNLEVVRVDGENHCLLVRGAVPGAINGEVLIRKTKKGVRSAKA